MAKPIVLCADSTCDLGAELVDRYNVHISPMHVHLGDTMYSDGVDITPDDIYAVYREKKMLPTTSATNMEEYKDFVNPFIEAGNDVLYISLGSGISTTYNSARLAAEETPGMYVINSGNLSTGMGLVVIEAAERIAAGMPIEQIVDEINALTKQVEASFVLDTLEFLHKGGRCSTLAALGANMLKLKPCIEVSNEDSTMTVGKKYRGALEKVLPEYVADRLKDRTDLVKSCVEQYQKFDEILITRAGCTISAHCGPNTLGILFVRK